MPKVTYDDLLDAFSDLCRAAGVVSRGFDYSAITAPIDGDKYDGTVQWAMKHTPCLGWMIVQGSGGCGVALGGAGDYVKKRRNFLAAIHMATTAYRKAGKEK